MIPKCAHLLPTGHRCRRIPKRGQRLCPAHLPHTRRAPLAEDDAFRRQIAEFTADLSRLPLPALLRATTELLAEVHPLIDRRACRRDRLTFTRATTALALATDRLQPVPASASTGAIPKPTTPPRSAIPISHPLPSVGDPSKTMACIEKVESILNSGRPISPQELDQLMRELDSCSPPEQGSSNLIPQ